MNPASSPAGRPESVEPRRIGELLVGKGVVSEDQVRIALTEQRRAQRESSSAGS